MSSIKNKINRKTFFISFSLAVGILISLFLGLSFLTKLENNSKSSEIQTYQECINKGFPRQITSPKSCQADGQVFYDAKELIPDSTIGYKLDVNDGVKNQNGFSYMSNQACRLRLNYRSKATNYAKNFGKESNNQEFLKTSFNNRVVSDYGMLIQTPNVGKFSILCIPQEKFNAKSLNSEYFQPGNLNNLYYLDKASHEKVNPDSIFVEDRFASGQINWYFSINNKVYLVTDWQNFAEKADIKLEVI
ncbi:MAG: hypothetical protein AAGF07_05385 [Patescibacteria group bacterium]